MCKEEGKIGEIIRKSIKKRPGLNVGETLRKVRKVLLTKREISTHEAIKRTLSLPMRSSNIGCDFIFTHALEKRFRVLKPQEVLQKIHPEDTNVFANGIIEKYANRPDDLENERYADFAAAYVNVNTKDFLEHDDIENYTTLVSNPNEEELSGGKSFF